jgi:hypothetical protein
MRRFLTEKAVPEGLSDAIKDRLVRESDRFIMGGDILHRKVREGIVAPYVEFVFREDLMEKLEKCARIESVVAYDGEGHQALPSTTEEAITEFIYDEIYMHFGAPQEIFTDGGKNLWAGVVQRYLEKIGTLHKGTSPYHPRHISSGT